MTGREEALRENRALWDEWTGVHETSAFYDLEGFRRGGVRLRAYELEEIGSVEGLEVLHLQCHFGMDTLSLARRGARVTGLDFSAPAVEAARRLAADLGIEATFVEADVRDAAAALGRTFDVVYTGIGALGWLPSVRRWAGVVASILRPGGFLYLAEIHPFATLFAEGEQRIALPYLEHAEPLVFDDPGTYADRGAQTAHNRTTEWSHGLGEVVTALIEAGLELEWLRERVELFYDFTGWLVERSPGVWVAPEGELPLLYSLRARRPVA
jgi:2-polyprenyl-3-methyl-5-hydroxy-6-metoxy-1,4-benzoquinol methylase